MNLPNKLTVLRMALVPFFVAALLWQGLPHHYLVALLLFVVASYTDHLDGKIARERNLITNFGKFMDPLADKILVLSALVCFVSLQLVNPWWVVIILARELLVTSLRLVAADEGIVIAANSWGKIKTVSQIAAIIAILAMQYAQELIGMRALPAFTIGALDSGVLFYWAGELLVFITVIFTALSGVIYMKQNWKVVSSSR
ncbi:CDP-diacylglycerol--glycerol-3-phosphate 3-phosphatidyltransferase [Clostridium sp. D33t1_170424_F3]|uniref:CDP-diacylglycerol--glycerol-3-phosphate 3-phosphatidyltransferase n=1 Tax=Clostridium sp. D33t1_170424_F3 TaxID=2787099 RepID=UPI0018AAA271|nr:CDP-diacylglycerol--glycerol-3-phosphate 3-phosphatidyltransferase [Clostridium sp. D33t1_170424_F3]